MTNARWNAHRGDYRAGYLRTRVWFARRDKWFRNELDVTDQLRCVVCGVPATPRQLELHHLDYSGVRFGGTRWTAGEAHADLVPLHPYCHEQLHRLIRRDRALSRLHGQRSGQALKRLRTKLAGMDSR